MSGSCRGTPPAAARVATESVLEELVDDVTVRAAVEVPDRLEDAGAKAVDVEVDPNRLAAVSKLGGRTGACDGDK